MGTRQPEFFHPVTMAQMKAISLVYRFIKSRVDVEEKFGMDDMYVVWFSKTLQNWKALISTNRADGMYYEVTYDGEKKRTYIDAYKKTENAVITDKSLVTEFELFPQERSQE